ncbi:MAG: galactokinase [Bacteroidales bacterium]|nr:galactokinase [Bacteroidales bacterium]
MNINELRNTFSERFGNDCDIYTSPGRVNLIGEHTDYNGGFVFPGAIDKGIYAAIRLNGTDKVRAYSIDKEDYREFGLTEADLPEQHWAKYLFGVCREIQKRGYTIGGFDTVFYGDVPIGAGVSSSAALESTFGYALNELFHLGIDKFELARIGQATEHHYVGVNCGIMDQFASLFGKEGQLMRLNCATMEFEYYPFHPKGYKVVLLDTLVKHELASSAYNKRRASCENACAHIAARHPEVKYLSDATMAMLDEVKAEIPAEDYMRAEYVIGEKQRVLDVCEALKRDDYDTVGKCMYGTHYGMSKLYEVSCEELDYLNDIAKQCGVTGSRVMGGGFGGCTINLVKDELYDSFIDTAKKQFDAKFGHEPNVYNFIISDGARKLPL